MPLESVHLIAMGPEPEVHLSLARLTKVGKSIGQRAATRTAKNVPLGHPNQVCQSITHSYLGSGHPALRKEVHIRNGMLEAEQNERTYGSENSQYFPAAVRAANESQIARHTSALHKAPRMKASNGSSAALASGIVAAVLPIGPSRMPLRPKAIASPAAPIKSRHTLRPNFATAAAA